MRILYSGSKSYAGQNPMQQVAKDFCTFTNLGSQPQALNSLLLPLCSEYVMIGIHNEIWYFEDFENLVATDYEKLYAVHFKHKPLSQN